jgi:hypothetical protein
MKRIQTLALLLLGGALVLWAVRAVPHGGPRGPFDTFSSGGGVSGLLFHGEIGSAGAITGNNATYVLADVNWSEVVDTNSVFAVSGGDDEVCYSGASLTNVTIRMALSFSSDGVASNTTTTAIGVAVTGLGDGDETGEVWVRDHGGAANSIGMGALEIVTDLAQDECIGILFQSDDGGDSPGDDITYNNGTVTVTR